MSNPATQDTAQALTRFLYEQSGYASQGKFARAAGVAVTTLNRILCGRSAHPSILILRKLAATALDDPGTHARVLRVIETIASHRRLRKYRPRGGTAVAVLLAEAIRKSPHATTDQSVAEAANMSYSYLSRILHGGRANLSADKAWNLARVLNLDIQQLLHAIQRDKEVALCTKPESS